MPRLRSGFAAAILVAATITNLQAAPINAPQTEAIERLAPALATRDPVRLAMAFRAMGNLGLPASDVVETAINSMGYRRLAAEDIDGAIKIFELNTEIFPLSANTWDSLAHAVMISGDSETAIRYYRRSLDLDPENANATRMLEQIEREQQFSQVRNAGF
jgi:tetratricopeptide (TPR) repeat protein